MTSHGAATGWRGIAPGTRGAAAGWRACAIDIVEAVGGKRALREAIDGAGDVLRVRVVPLEKARFDRAVRLDHPPEDPEKRDEVGSARPAVRDRSYRFGVAPGIEPPHEAAGRGPHRREQRVDRPQHARYAAERERGGAIAGHLEVARGDVAADPVDRIGDVGAAVELPVETVERRPRFRRKAA